MKIENEVETVPGVLPSVRARMAVVGTGWVRTDSSGPLFRTGSIGVGLGIDQTGDVRGFQRRTVRKTLESFSKV